MKIKIILISLVCVIHLGNGQMMDQFPGDPLDIKKPVSFQEMELFLSDLQEIKFIHVTAEGKSHQGRSIYSVRLFMGKEPARLRILLYAQQHGDEPAGKDALLFLLRDIARNPEMLPDDIELVVFPMMNPDGAVANTRFNTAGADLNRDHILLQQPETQALYKVALKFRPHISVDCHEFARDSKDYDDKGWLEWPQIMMDTANNPFFNPQIMQMGLEWCNSIAPILEQKGINYMRYHVGGAPPDGEQRYSAPDIDDGRNGLACYGGLSFIIESGVQRRLVDSNADLGIRIRAYLAIFEQLLHNSEMIEKSLQVLSSVDAERTVPEFIPTNYFWANNGQKITEVKVINKLSGKTEKVRAANFMHDLVIKKSVSVPEAYIIDAQYAEIFKDLLDRNSISYKVLSHAQSFRVEASRLIRFEDYSDSLYNRYADRQIVENDAPKEKLFSENSLFIPVGSSMAVRTILVLEPNSLYGLYQYVEFRKLIGEDRIVPVYRYVP